MSISFSGLASGLDTSSWVESLVALKKAKIDTLEEQKENVLLSQETLNSIKSFFSSFRSVLEKVTDTKFGVASMDIFAQNLANSSNLEVLTASATSEAEESVYNILVDKLASNTRAESNYSYMTTIVQTTTATYESKLSHLGVKAGNIGVTVNGVEHGITISENDTLSSFTEKLKEIGVDASYNEQTGVFSVNLNEGDINDIDGTGIVDALHLYGVNEGYTSGNLQISHTNEVFSAADESTLMSELGVKAGTITITSNESNYNVTITNSTTLGSFMADLRSHNIDTELDLDGMFTIKDAVITNEGATGIIDALGLSSDVSQKSQITKNLTHATIVTEVTTATSDTMLKDIGEGLTVTDGQTVIVKNSNNEYTTITLSSTTTIGDLLEKFQNAGLFAEINSDGAVEIAGGAITGGTFDAVKALGLESTPYSAMASGKALTETVEVHELVTLQTKLVDDLKVKEGYIEVTDTAGAKHYEKIRTGQTIADFMAEMGNLGINTSLDEETGVLTITGGAFKTLSDADVQALVKDGTIREQEARYQQGTNLLECLYGADVISTDHIDVSSTYSKSRALTRSVTTTIEATKDTTLKNLGLSGNGTAVFDVRGEKRTVNLTQDMTLQGLMDALKSQGIASSFDEDTGRIRIENAALTGGTSNLTSVLNLTKEISGKYVTSKDLYATKTVTIDATRDTVLSDFGIKNSMSNDDKSVKVYSSDGTLKGTMTVSESTTIGGLMDFLKSKGIESTLIDGVLTIHDGYIVNKTLEEAMGLEHSNKSSFVLGSVMTVTTQSAVTGDTTLGNIIDTLGTGSKVSGGYNMSFNSHSLSVSATTTINDLIGQIQALGGTAVLDSTGRLTIEGGTLSGTVANALGIRSFTTTSYVEATGETMYTKEVVNATKETKMSDLGISNSTYTVYDKLGNALATYTVSGSTTIGDFLNTLKSNGIDGTISEGVISLKSADGRYIAGALANSLGIGTQTVTDTVNTTQYSTARVTYTETRVAGEDDIISQFVSIGDGVLTVKDTSGTLGTVTIGASTTFNDLLTALAGYGISGTMRDGILYLKSPDDAYVTGDLMTNMNISTTSVTKTVTSGMTATSSSVLSHTNSVKATEGDLMSAFGVKAGTVTVHKSDGSVFGTVNVTNTMTFDEFMEKLGEFGISANLHDGVLSFESVDGNYISGTPLADLGIGLRTVTVTTTVGMTQTGKLVNWNTSQTAAQDDKISDYVSIGDGVVTVKRDSTTLGTFTLNSSSTFDDMITALAGYGISAVMKDGVISFNSESGAYATGTVLSNLGVSTTTTTETVTIGSTATSSSAITSSKGVKADEDSVMSQFGVSTGAVTVYGSNGSAIGTVNVSNTTTFGQFFAELGKQGITGTIYDGVVSFSSSDGRYVNGTPITSMGAGISQTTVTTTVGTSRSGSLVNWTEHRSARLSDRIYDIMGPFSSSVSGDENVVDIYDLSGKWIDSIYLNASSYNNQNSLTFDDLFTWLAGYGISCWIDEAGNSSEHGAGAVHIAFSGDYYCTGAFFNKCGLWDGDKPEFTTTTKTVGTTFSKSLSRKVTNYADYNSKIRDFVTSGYSNTFTVVSEATDTKPKETYTFSMSSSSTFADWFKELGKYGITGTITDGVIRLSSDSSYKLSGGFLSNIGISVSNGRTVTNYRSVSRLSKEFDLGKRNVNGNDLCSSYVGSAIYLYNNSENKYATILLNSTSTFDTLFSELASFGIQAYLAGGYLRVANYNDNWYFSNNNTTLNNYGILSNSFTQTVSQDCTSATITVTANSATSATIQNLALSAFGITQNSVIGISDHGTSKTIVIAPSMRVSDLVAQFNNYGITLDLVNPRQVATGRVSFSVKVHASNDPANVYVTNFGLLGTRLHLGTPYKTQSVYKVNNSNYHTMQTKQELTEDTNLDVIYKNWSCYYMFASIDNLKSHPNDVPIGAWNSDIYPDTPSWVRTFDMSSPEYGRPETVGDLIKAFANIGVSVSISGNRLLLSEGNVVLFAIDDVTYDSDLPNHDPMGWGINVETVTERTYNYTNSRALSYSTTATATSSTKLSELQNGFSGAGYITVVSGGTSHNVAVSGSQTVGELIDILNSYGIKSMLTAGSYFQINASDDAYVSGWSSDFNTLFGNAGSGKTYTTKTVTTGVESYETDPIEKCLYITKTHTLDSSTTFGNLGISSGNIYVNHEGKTHTVGVTGNQTLGEFLTALAGLGVTGSIKNGVLTLEGTNDGYITDMDSTLKSKFGITTGNGYTYTTSSSKTTHNTSSSQRNRTVTETMTTATTLRDLGVTQNQTVTVFSKGQSTTLTFGADSSIDDIISALAGLDITGTVQDGKLTLRGSKDSYITGMSADLTSKLKLTVGAGATYSTSTVTHYKNTNSTAKTRTVAHTMTSESKLSEFGCAGGNITVFHEGKSHTVNFNSSHTVGDIISALAGLGISGSVQGGKLVLQGTNDGYITAMDDAIKNSFGLAVGLNSSYSTSTKNNVDNTNSNKTHSRSVVTTMTTDTTLRDLGVTSNQTVTVFSKGQSTTLTFGADSSIDDIISSLAGLDITGTVQDGKLTLRGSKDSYITAMSADLTSKLKLTVGKGYTYTTSDEVHYANTASSKTQKSFTEAITGDKLLKNIDGYSHGNGKLRIHQTNGQFVDITIDQNWSLNKFFDEIGKYGLVGTIDNEGKISITGVGNVYLQNADGGSNILSALKLSNLQTNVRTVTVNRTSNNLKHTITVKATGTTSLQNLQDVSGKSITFDASGNASIVLNTTSNAGNNNITLTFSKTQSLHDIIDELAKHGIQASIDSAGRFSVNSSTLTDFEISGELGKFLMGTYQKVYNENSTQSSSTILARKTVEFMDDTSLLSNWGITKGNILITQEGVTYTVNIDNTIETISDFRNLLSKYGFDSFVDNQGRLNVTGVGNSYLASMDGGSNILKVLGLDDWTLGEITQTSDQLTDTRVEVGSLDWKNKISEITDSAGANLNIKSGSIWAYQDGTRHLIHISASDTLETLAAKLSQYGINMSISSDGKLYFEGTNDSYLTTDGLTSDQASDILSKLNVSNNWSTRYDSTSRILEYDIHEDKVMQGSTKLKDLQDADGKNLGITEGSFYVYQNGVRHLETITSDMTVNDLKAMLAGYGLITDVAEDGSISIGAYNNTYLATSQIAGANSNIVSTLFAQWDFTNVYTSNGLDIPKDVIQAVNRNTKLKDINDGNYKAGTITVIKDGVQTNITLSADDTLGTLMDELAMYGFDSVINDNGQLIIKNTGDSKLQAASGSGASNILDILGIGIDKWISTNTYSGENLDVVKTTQKTISADRDTLLSELGVTTGEYNIWNNGVKITALISSDETLGSLMETLKKFGLETSLVAGENGAKLSIVGKGDVYIQKSNSTTNSSNVVEQLFENSTPTAKFDYKGLQQTSQMVTIFENVTEATKLSELSSEWGERLDGNLSVTVNGQENVIKISADETIASLLEKFRSLGLEATLADGKLMIQSGFNSFTINTDRSTSSLANQSSKTGLTYNSDLGGYLASSDTVRATTTTIEERTFSVANYADMNTKLGLINISDGSLTVYRDGEKASIQILENETFGQFRSRIANAFSDVDITFEDGYLKFYSKTGGVKVEVGATTDTSNFAAITGISNSADGTVKSARELYCVNNESLVTQEGIFRRGNVKEGTFYIGDAMFTIDSSTKLSQLIAQINSNEAANASAYWDNIDGKLVLTSRTTGASFVNVEAGTSNFTDIMGLTTSEWNDDGSLKVTKMNTNIQKVGDNAKFKINGTTYTSTSNTITSDVSRIKGVTLNLKGISEEGSEVTLTVEKDKETVANAISDVVDAYNELMKNVDQAISVSGQLHGESTLKLIRNQLRSLMTSSEAGTTIFRNLFSIGIETSSASGSNLSTDNSAIIDLTFNKDKFLQAYEADHDAVKALLVGSETNSGIFNKVETLVESALAGVSGYFDSRNTSFNKEVERIDTKIVKGNEAIERYRERLQAKFSSMDMIIAQIQQQYSSFLGT